MKDYIVEAEDISKIYKLKGRNKSIQALNQINFMIEEGEKFGLLGPNGAGKTTLISILTTLLQPTTGTARIAGYDIRKESLKIKRKIGLMLGESMVYHRLSGYNNLKFYCKIYEIPDYKKKIIDKAEELGIKKWLNQYVEHYSTGMKIKLSLCRILVLEPQILFLDEPTLGLDVNSTQFIIQKLKELDKTIILTSHNMNIVDKICNRIAFIKDGRILKIGNKEKLKQLQQKGIKISLKVDKLKSNLKRDLEQQEYIEQINESESGLNLILKSWRNYQDLFSILKEYPITNFQESKISIEDLFLKIIKN